MDRAAFPKKSTEVGKGKEGSSPKRIPLKTLNLHKLDKSTIHLNWKQKLRESCYRRVRQDRARLLWKVRSNSDQTGAEKEFVKNAFQGIVSDELKKIKDVSAGGETLTGTDDMLWEYDGLHTAYEGECEDILLEMQRIFYEDLKADSRGRENAEVWEDEEGEYLARAVFEHMQLNDEKAHKEEIWCPICKAGEVKEKPQTIYCNLCPFQLRRGDETDSCSTHVNYNDLVSFDTTSLSCQSVWQAQGFILRYEKVNSKTWSFLLSASTKVGYVAIGFSNDGSMVGSSAMVGWQENGSTGRIMQYYLGDQSVPGVKPGEGNLDVVKNSTAVFIQSSSIYLAFQLTTSQPSDQLIFAVGSPSFQPRSPSYQLQQHLYRTPIQFNYASGQSETLKSPYAGLRKTHGIVNILAWGILIPLGALTARYFRRWDPIWFYSHVAFQTIGFVLGLTGIILGFVLDDLLNAGVAITNHKRIGITILVLGCLQITALFVRPKKGSKPRKYWNWYHQFAGRLIIILIVANIFYGIRLGNEGVSWSLSYGVILAIMVIASIFGEIKLRRVK